MTAILAEPNLLAAHIGAGIIDAYATMMRSKASLLAQIAEFDYLGLAQDLGATSTSAWLIRRLGISHSTAHEYVAVARQLDNFPYLKLMFEEGKLSYSAVRLLLKYLTPDNEVELVNRAMELGYHGLEHALAGKPKTGAGEDSPEHYLRMSQDDNGDVNVWAKLDAADGEAFAAALKIGHLAFCAEEEELAELIDDASIDNLYDQKIDEEKELAKRDKSSFGLPTGRAMLYALMGMVNIVRTNPKNALRAPAAQVNVMMTVSGEAYLPNNAGATSTALANIVSNAMMKLNIVDKHGLVLNVGRGARLATDKQVKALMAMWGGQCAMPGCIHRRFMEIHHIHEWADGGLTDLDNLLPLCSGCHSLVTDGYVKIQRDRHNIVFDFRDGARFVSYNFALPVRDDDYVCLPIAEDGGDSDSFAG